MKTVAQTLKITPNEHSLYLLDTYMVWCEAFAEDNADLQKLMANTKLFHYWKSVYDVLEYDFIQVAQYYELDKDAMWDLYNSMTIHIGQYFSKPLIKKALNTKNYEYRAN
jgi:hypothetical protein